MPHPLIILGAGASYGYLTEEQKELRKGVLDFPLVDNICKQEYLDYLYENIKSEKLKMFVDLLISKEIRDVLVGGKDFIGQIHARLMGVESLEKELTDIWERAKQDEIKKRQMIAFAYYLHFLFYFLSKDTEKKVGGNSYDVLISKISDFLQDNKDGIVSIINFNYDLLMVGAKKKGGFDEGKNKNKLLYYSIHGQCDKCFICSPRFYSDTHRVNGDLNSEKDRIRTFDLDEFFKNGPEEYDYIEICKRRQEGKSYIPRPVLILPFSKKKIDYRYKEAKNYINEIDRILLVGWSAKDEEFIKLIKENIGNKKLPLCVVTDEKAETDGINDKFEGVYSDFIHNREGFAKFVRSENCKNFLNN